MIRWCHSFALLSEKEQHEDSFQLQNRDGCPDDGGWRGPVDSDTGGCGNEGEWSSGLDSSLHLDADYYQEYHLHFTGSRKISQEQINMQEIIPYAS